MEIPTVASIQAYVSDCYQVDAPEFLAYHNLAHTESVVAHCLELANHYHLNENDKNNLLIAAWFHDVGHLYTIPQGHEEKSVEIMQTFLHEKFPAGDLAAIERLILATKISVRPTSLLECIIRDADTYHFGTKEFFTTDALVRREMELRTGLSFPFWHQHSVELLKSHQFYTSYCQQHLEAGKQENIRILEAQS
jgi:predicted metal-dependent HD superfamily phosphohydrolase